MGSTSAFTLTHVLIFVHAGTTMIYTLPFYLARVVLGLLIGLLLNLPLVITSFMILQSVCAGVHSRVPELVILTLSLSLLFFSCLLLGTYVALSVSLLSFSLSASSLRTSRVCYLMIPRHHNPPSSQFHSPRSSVDSISDPRSQGNFTILQEAKRVFIIFLYFPIVDDDTMLQTKHSFTYCWYTNPEPVGLEVLNEEVGRTRS